MPRLNAGDYAQNSEPKVLTTPGPHPQTYTPGTLTQPGLPSIFTTPYIFILPQVQPWSPQMCVCVSLSPGCAISILVRLLLFSFNLKQGRKIGRCQIFYMSPPYEHGGEQSPCLVPALEADSHEEQVANGSVTVEVSPRV